MDCDCQIVNNDGDNEIEYCPLHAAAPLMLEALKAVEWCGDYPYDPCLWCDGYKAKGHAPGCPRQAAIAAAEPVSKEVE